LGGNGCSIGRKWVLYWEEMGALLGDIDKNLLM